MLCEESLTRQLDTGVVGWANHGFPRRQTVSRESDEKLHRPMGQIDTFVEPINTRGLGTRVLRELSRPRGGHETGLCTFRCPACPNVRSPMLGRPDRASLTDGAKIKADEATEDLRK